MAVDNYERYKAVNAIVAAWVRYDSLPFIRKKTIASGASGTFDVAHPYTGLLLCFGMNNATTAAYLVKVNSTGANAYTKIMTGAASGLAITYASNQFTITNSGSVGTDVYFISFVGSVE